MTTTAIDHIYFSKGDLYVLFDVYIASDSDSCVLTFPSTTQPETVTLTSDIIGTTGSFVRFYCTIDDDTLVVKKVGETGEVTTKTSTNVETLIKLTMTTTSGCDVRLITSGCYSLSPAAQDARWTAVLLWHIAIILILAALGLGLGLYCIGKKSNRIQ